MKDMGSVKNEDTYPSPPILLSKKVRCQVHFLQFMKYLTDSDVFKGGDDDYVAPEEYFSEIQAITEIILYQAIP